jgi:hypothetical protein
MPEIIDIVPGRLKFFFSINNVVEAEIIKIIKRRPTVAQTNINQYKLIAHK